MALEGNREAAEQCIDAGHRALDRGDVEKARRMLMRSQRMYALPGGVQQELARRIDRYETESPKGEERRTEEKKMTGETERERERKRKGGEEGERNMKRHRREAKEEEEGRRTYTKEQLEVVRRVRRATCLYEVLGLKKGDVDTDAIKKGYKRLALKLHPDKNGAPGADEAFKRVSHAFQVLSDKKRRERYDRFGVDSLDGSGGSRPREASNLRRRARSGHDTYMYTSLDEDFMTPEELFEFLFANAPVRSASHRTHHPYSLSGLYARHEQMQQQQNSDFLDACCGLRPVLVAIFLIAFLVLSGWPEGPGFSLSPTDYYVIPKITSNGVRYFIPRVTQDTDRSWKTSLERKVDQAVLELYWDKCAQERDIKHSLLQQSKRVFMLSETRERYRRQHQEYETRSCDHYYALAKRIRESRLR